MATADVVDKMVKVGVILLKGLSVPFVAGMLAYAVTYPLGAYSCHAYGDAKELNTKYVWFNCYVQDSGKWYEKTEYLSSKIGVKFVLAPQL